MVRRLLVLIALLSPLSIGTAASHERRPSVLYVRGAVAPSAFDRAITSRLEALGYTVIEAQSPTTRDVQAASVVLLSDGVPVTLAVRLGQLPIPLLTWQPQLFAALGMTRGDRSDCGRAGAEAELLIANASHPLGAGVPTRVRVVPQAGALAWALPAGAPTIIATLASDTNKAALFGYEEGARMRSRFAAARRVGLFLDPKAPATREGWRLFENALRWVMTRNQAPIATIAGGVAGGVGEPIVLEGVVTDDGLPENATLATRWTVVSGPGPVRLDDETAAVTQARFERPGTYVLALSARDGRLESRAQTTIAITPSASRPAATEPETIVAAVPPGTGALLITAGTPLKAIPSGGDIKLRTRMQSLGFTVTTRSAASYNATTDLTGVAVVVITATAHHPDMGTKFRDLPIGVVNMRLLTFGPNGLTGPINNKDYGMTSKVALAMVSPPPGSPADPLAAGLSGTVTIGTAGPLVWGMPSAKAVVTATIPGAPTHATVFRYAPGVPLVGGVPAPGRRVGLFPSPTAAVGLNANGSALFDAALAWAAGFSNAAPQVNAGPDRSALTGSPIPLEGWLADDGFPALPAATWTVVSCSGTAAIADESAPITTITFSDPGTCVLRLTADDGQLAASDDVEIAVYAQNTAPAVSAGASQSVAIQSPALLSGSVVDADRLPHPPAVTGRWSKVSGPGGVMFGDATALVTTATFTAPGAYVLRLTGSDGELSASADTTVTVTSTVLFVVGNSAQLTAGETLAHGRLLALGHDVELKSANVSLPKDAARKALVVISPAAPSGQVAAKFARAAVPVVCQQIGNWDDFGLALSGTRGGVGGQTSIAILGAPSHPIAAGLTGTQPISTAPAGLSWGTPAPSAVKIATPVGAPGTFVVFAYEKGKVMAGLVAPARRVALGFQDNLMPTLTAQGRAIFDAAVTWAMKSNRTPSVDAGPDQTVASGLTATLAGSVTDDRMPSGVLTLTWSLVSGPGTATFADASAAGTDVTFSTAGTYVLRLTASDGQLEATDEVVITL
jgi:hypothetical protein